MKCKVCAKVIAAPDQPFAVAPPDFAWCTRECWNIEGDLSKETLQKGERLGWNPRLVRFGKQAKLP